MDQCEPKEKFIYSLISQLEKISSNLFEIFMENNSTLTRFWGSEPDEKKSEVSLDPNSDSEKIGALLKKIESLVKQCHDQSIEIATIL